ncbi:SARP family transcriptional regulator [uncultured Aliiroseovarius sp.]|uniref:SARP family transcriptional regulator n=1 Tax=uncultured Aliiroseovarius sp. TaxID=1658783 RepID=UPI002596CC08|nr:SARP family transcriptional regulator [uncultured Aliiroseovarius sp.]
MNLDQMHHHDLDIFLLGPLDVQDHRGNHFTPKNQKSKAVLAMLALAPRGSRSRVWLRDKLWSDRGEDQASASLRQALLDIRKCLGDDKKDILSADKYSVSLDLSRVRVDAVELIAQVERDEVARPVGLDTVSEHFLEGFDICDPEFESWLTLERQIWEQRLVDQGTDASPQPDIAPHVLGVSRASTPDPAASTHLNTPQRHQPAQSPTWAIGVQSGPAGDVHAALLIDKLTRNLREMGRVPCVHTIDNHPMTQRGIEVPLILRVAEMQQGPSVRLSAELLSGADGVTVWSSSQAFTPDDFAQPACPALNSLVSHAVIQIGRHLQRQATTPQMAGAGQLIECIYQIFGLSMNELTSAEDKLAHLLKLQPNAQTYAWMAFAKSFQVGQRFTPDAAAQISEAQYYATRALEEDEFDPLVLSLAAHIHSYLFSEFDMAASLFERALKIDPEQAIGWDLYATMNAYTGDTKKSLAMASWAQHLGSNTPISYYFDTTKCIAAALAGDHHAAISAGEKALVQRPKFNSILRYLISSHAHLGNVQMVESLRQKLAEIEPDFSPEVLRGSGYPGLATEGGRQFLLGLRKAGFDKD